MQRRVLNPSTVFDSRRYGFSQAVAVEGGEHVFISGQVGVDTDERVVGHDLAAQTEAALDNLARVLEAAGGTLADVVSLRIYLVAAAASDLTPVGSALRSRFGRDRPPASTWLVISALADPELLIEIEAQAVLAWIPPSRAPWSSLSGRFSRRPGAPAWRGWAGRPARGAADSTAVREP
jgi:2-iminobutanoate/2-iminopropanoate deaminase